MKNVVIGGGVSANAALRFKMSDVCKQNDINIFFADKKFCSDNAAMIALAGHKKIEFGARVNDLKQIDPQLRIKNWRFSK